MQLIGNARQKNAHKMNENRDNHNAFSTRMFWKICSWNLWYDVTNEVAENMGKKLNENV